MQLNVSLIQSEITWEAPGVNLPRFEGLIQQLSMPTDLIVLPEMFSTGFSMNPAPIAESMEGPTVSWMAQQAARANAVVCGSIIAQDNGKYYNRLVWMQPDGHYQYYDKRHLFGLAGEDGQYEAGSKRLIVQWRGWSVLPLICYDLRFPVWSRNTDGYDLLLYVANWPEKRRNAWKSLLVGRAIENQVYTIGVNRVGTDGNGFDYTGDTSLVDFEGQTLYSLSRREGVITLTLDREKQENYRQKLPFLADQDIFTIN